MIATAENLDGKRELTVEVYHKNSDDTGSGALASGTAIKTSGGRSSSTWGGLKELVRYRYSVKGAADQYVMFRMLSPVWFDEVKA